jgi:hypothetical protein
MLCVAELLAPDSGASTVPSNYLSGTNRSATGLIECGTCLRTAPRVPRVAAAGVECCSPALVTTPPLRTKPCRRWSATGRPEQCYRRGSDCEKHHRGHQHGRRHRLHPCDEHAYVGRFPLRTVPCDWSGARAAARQEHGRRSQTKPSLRLPDSSRRCGPQNPGGPSRERACRFASRVRYFVTQNATNQLVTIVVENGPEQRALLTENGEC